MHLLMGHGGHAGPALTEGTGPTDSDTQGVEGDADRPVACSLAPNGTSSSGSRSARGCNLAGSARGYSDAVIGRIDVVPETSAAIIRARKRRSRRALETTVTLESAIAAAAKIGSSRMPVNG